MSRCSGSREEVNASAYLKLVLPQCSHNCDMDDSREDLTILIYLMMVS